MVSEQACHCAILATGISLIENVDMVGIWEDNCWKATIIVLSQLLIWPIPCECWSSVRWIWVQMHGEVNTQINCQVNPSTINKAKIYLHVIVWILFTNQYYFIVISGESGVWLFNFNIFVDIHRHAGSCLLVHTPQIMAYNNRRPISSAEKRIIKHCHNKQWYTCLMPNDNKLHRRIYSLK